jgi:hypothetical protein
VRIEQSARKLAASIRELGFAAKVRVEKSRSGLWRVWFNTTTTKTRASSMASRIRLLAFEISSNTPVSIDKILIGSRPRKREDITSWEISANFQNAATDAAKTSDRRQEGMVCYTS